MTTSMITHTTTRHMRHIVATMTTHRIVMNRMSNTVTMGIITMLTRHTTTKAIATTLILTKTMITRHTSTMLILTTLMLTTLTLIIMARVSPSRRSRPRRLGSWWRR